MQSLKALVQVCLIFCIAFQLVNAEAIEERADEIPSELPNALRAKYKTENDDSDRPTLTEESQFHIIRIPKKSLKIAEKSDAPKNVKLETEKPTEDDVVGKRKDLRNRLYSNRVRQILSRLIPMGEIRLLRFFNDFLQEVILQQREICESVEREEIQPTPFFNCSVFTSKITREDGPFSRQNLRRNLVANDNDEEVEGEGENKANDPPEEVETKI